MASKSKYVCGRCGLAVYTWRGNTWKHAANIHARSCGKPPQVVSREEYEAEIEAMAKAVRRFTNGKEDD